MTLTVLMGIPTSGKSTWLAQQPTGQLVLSADVLRTDHHARTNAVFAAMEHQARRALRTGRDVAIDACSTQATRRAEWLALARQASAHTRLVCCDVQPDLARLRNHARPEAQRFTHANLERYIDRWPAALAAALAEPWAEVITASPARTSRAW